MEACELIVTIYQRHALTTRDNVTNEYIPRKLGFAGYKTNTTLSLSQHENQRKRKFQQQNEAAQQHAQRRKQHPAQTTSCTCPVHRNEAEMEVDSVSLM